MRYLLLFSLSLLLLFTQSCSQITVQHDYKSSVDFSSLQTYGWSQIEKSRSEDIRVNNPLLHDRFTHAITQALHQKGFLLHPEPDFRITYDYSITTRVEASPFTTRLGFGFGHRRHYGEMTFGHGVEVYQYDVGTLVIDVVSTESEKVIWRGTGSYIITRKTPEELTQLVHELVDEIFLQFPPY